MPFEKCIWIIENKLVIDRTQESHIGTLLGVIVPEFDPDEIDWIFSDNEDCPECEDQS